MDVLKGKMYIDSRGWMYRVMSGIGEDRFKARYCKPDKAGWHGVKKLPWRETHEGAQADLDKLAQEKGWMEA
jgi:hypothetical protein